MRAAAISIGSLDRGQRDHFQDATLTMALAGILSTCHRDLSLQHGNCLSLDQVREGEEE
jgi:hypothetical protein